MMEPRPLPRPASLMFGREAELDTLAELLDGHSRVVVVHGAPGMGTSRVALAAAHRVEDAGGEVRRIDLEGVESRQQLTTALAGCLSISPEAAAGRVESESWPVVEAIRARDGLVLLLDDAGSLGDEAVAMLGDLVERAPELTLLFATARRLDLDGERTVTLSPLRSEAEGFGPAVELLADRAGMGDTALLKAPVRDALRRICEELSGIPLALELVAPRLRLLPAEELAQHLTDNNGLLARGSTSGRVTRLGLDETLDWSLATLAADELAALARLAHFRGAFNLEDATALLDVANPLDVLEALEARALLFILPNVRGGHFELLRPMAARVRQRMRAEMNASVGLYSRHMAELAKHLLRPEASGGIPAAGRLRDLRVAHEIGEATEPGSDCTLRLASAMAAVLSATGPLEEGARVLRKALSRTHADRDTRASAWVLLGSLLRRLGDSEGADRALTKGIDIGGARGGATAEAHLRRAMVALTSGDLWRARELFEASVGACGWTRTESSALFGLASVSPRSAAAELAQRALAVGRRCPDAEGKASASINAGHHAIARGEGAAAQRHLERALALTEEGGLAYLAGHTRALLALSADLQGASGAALEHYARGLDVLDRVGARELSALLRGARAQHYLFHGRPLAARADAEESLDALAEGDGRYASALWSCLGAILASLGDFGMAQQALTSARARLDDLATDDAFIYRSTYALFAGIVAVQQASDARSARHDLAAALDHAGRPPSDVIFFGDPQLQLLRIWCARWLADEAPPSEEHPLPALLLGPGANHMQAPGSAMLDLSRRGSVRRVLLTLCYEHPQGAALDTARLFQAGWPGETIRPESASERVYWAIKVLRRAGLRPYLQRTEEGYRLSPALSIERLDGAGLGTPLR